MSQPQTDIQSPSFSQRLQGCDTQAARIPFGVATIYFFLSSFRHSIRGWDTRWNSFRILDCGKHFSQNHKEFRLYPTLSGNGKDSYLGVHLIKEWIIILKSMAATRGRNLSRKLCPFRYNQRCHVTSDTSVLWCNSYKQTTTVTSNRPDKIRKS